MSDKQKKYLCCGVLILFIFLAYYPLFSNGFVSIDDNAYVTNNAMVQSGLNSQSVQWAFTSLHAEFWHPITWLSLMANTELYGVKAVGYHSTNLLLHTFNTLLLFFFLWRATSQVYRSFFAAALFAVHPLHVESVAWVAQRKDLLSTFFFLLVLLFYLSYSRKKSFARYIPVLLLYILGLMAKPMLVTLPFVLLLLDFWPLKRLDNPGRPHLLTFSQKILPLIREKIPLFLLSFLFSAITVFAQRQGGGIVSLERYPFSEKLMNAVVSYAAYIGDFFKPTHLAVFYPFNKEMSMWLVSLCALLICSCLVIAFIFRKSKPYILTGFLWYLGSLLPVIGIVKIGDFARADRYTYIPLMGIYFALTWLVADMISRLNNKKLITNVLVCSIYPLLIFSTFMQTSYWHDSVKLFTHALNSTEKNFLAHHILGTSFAEKGKFGEARKHFEKAVEYRKDIPRLWFTLGRLKSSQKNYQESLHDYFAALKIDQTQKEAHYLAGISLVALGRTHEAIAHFLQALPETDEKQSAVRPENDSAYRYYRAGLELLAKEEKELAINSFQEALKADRKFLPAIKKIIMLKAYQGNDDGVLKLLGIDNSLQGCHLAVMKGYEGWVFGVTN